MTSFLFGWWLNNSYQNGDLRKLIFTAKLGQAYFLREEKSKSIRVEKDPVNCPSSSYLGIATFGQSHLANSMLREAPINLSNLDVYMYDWVSGMCYRYEEPVVGTTGSFDKNLWSDKIFDEEMAQIYQYVGGNMVTRIIEKLRILGVNKSIVVGAFAVNGSSAFYWSSGRKYSRLNAFLESSKQRNINFDLFLWHQGSTDSIPRLYNHHSKVAIGHEHKTKYQLYKDSLSEILAKVKDAFPLAKIGIAISSGCNGSHVNIGKGNETTYEHFFDREVAQAQRSVALSSADFFISAETNDLMGAGRTDPPLELSFLPKR